VFLPSSFKKSLAGATTRKGLISHTCYPYRVRQSVVHRGRWSQTKGGALWHHSVSTFLASHYPSIDGIIHFHSLWCRAGFALHGRLKGAYVQEQPPNQAAVLIGLKGQHSCNEGKWSLNKKITSW
jgi:hypothetical protein